MGDPTQPRRHNSARVRAVALVAGLALLLLGAVLVWHGITGFTDEAGSGDLSGRNAAVELLVVVAGGGSLVLALVAARVAEVI